VAEELGTSIGQKVSFKIRFTDATSNDTLVKVMTDGVLLAESQHDRFFDHYDTLIIDEAHERSLNIDFLLGYLHRLLPKRPDLRLIITSATIDAQRFAENFKRSRPAPVIEVTGRTYPVETLYRPLVREDDRDEIETLRGVADGVEELCRMGGDVLVFLPTERYPRASHMLRGQLAGRATGNPAALCSAFDSRPESRVREARRPADRAGDERRRVVAHRAGHSLRVDTGTARISRYSAQQSPATANRGDFASFGRSA
jgi:ATP-dependent helicase HrpA